MAIRSMIRGSGLYILINYHGTNAVIHAANMTDAPRGYYWFIQYESYFWIRLENFSKLDNVHLVIKNTDASHTDDPAYMVWLLEIEGNWIAMLKKYRYPISLISRNHTTQHIRGIKLDHIIWSIWYKKAENLTGFQNQTFLYKFLTNNSDRRLLMSNCLSLWLFKIKPIINYSQTQSFYNYNEHDFSAYSTKY